VPCRIGTNAMLVALEQICAGHGKPGDIEYLIELGEHIKSSSLCGLGQTAPNPVLSTLRYFRDEYDAHIYEKRCPAKVCKGLITYSVDAEKCTGCMVCLRNCTSNAISGAKQEVHVIDQVLCSRCGICFNLCKFDAIIVQ
jgi:NADH-quinone oxidoreductase subunit F